MRVMETARLYGHLMYFRFKEGSPRRYAHQWDSYWRTIEATGPGGGVLWDSVPDRAAADDLERFAPYLNPGLPLIDVGCGNGRQTRFLADHFDRVLGVDVSSAAVERAEAESADHPASIEYRVFDATRPDRARDLAAELGPCNLYVRGMLHVIQPRDRPRVIESLGRLLGEEGVLYDIELAHEALDYFRTLPGASPSGLPRLVHDVVRHGVQPVGFSRRDRQALFPADEWTVLGEGPTAIHTVELENGEEGRVPARWMVLRRRPRSH